MATAGRVRRGNLAQENEPTARRRMAPEDRREQIVAEAIAFFTEKGFDGATRSLSERIGITQPLLYKYFPTKRDLVEAVYERVYVGRLRPHWAGLIVDRTLPVGERMRRFYVEYADAILTREWVRLFVFAGLQGEDINDRYLKQLGRIVIEPLHGEIVETARRRHGPHAKIPSLDDIWVHHGGIFYLGVREHIYGVGKPDDLTRTIIDATQRFIDAYDLE